MKIARTFFLLAALTFSAVGGAASVTITTTGAHDARLGPAFGARLGLVDVNGVPRNATTAEVKAWLIKQLEAVVRNYEYEQSQKSIATQPFDPN